VFNRTPDLKRPVVGAELDEVTLYLTRPAGPDSMVTRHIRVIRVFELVGLDIRVIRVILVY
jgi:hypothetical protein